MPTESISPDAEESTDPLRPIPTQVMGPGMLRSEMDFRELVNETDNVAYSCKVPEAGGGCSVKSDGQVQCRI